MAMVIPSAPVILYIKEILATNPSVMLVEIQLVDITWLIKPFIAYIFDILMRRKYDKRLFPMIGSSVCCVMWFVLPLLINLPVLFYSSCIIINIFLAFCDVSMDADLLKIVQIIVKCTPNGGNISEMIQNKSAVAKYAGRCLGALLACVITALTHEIRYIFWLDVIVLTIFLVLTKYDQSANAENILKYYFHQNNASNAYNIEYGDVLKRVDANTDTRINTTTSFLIYMKRDIYDIYSTLYKEKVLSIIIIGLIYSSLPNPLYGYTYVYSDVLHTSALDLQFIYFAKDAGLFFGNILYMYSLDAKYDNYNLVISTCSTLISGTFIVHSLVVFSRPFRLQVMSIFFLETAIYTLKTAMYFPVILYVAPFCPEGLEATSYSIINNLDSLGTVIDTAIGIVLMQIFMVSPDNIFRLWYISSCCAMIMSIPTVFMFKFPLINKRCSTDDVIHHGKTD